MAADNLAAHSLAGIFENFAVGRVCQFCTATRRYVQAPLNLEQKTNTTSRCRKYNRMALSLNSMVLKEDVY